MAYVISFYFLSILNQLPDSRFKAVIRFDKDIIVSFVDFVNRKILFFHYFGSTGRFTVFPVGLAGITTFIASFRSVHIVP